MATSSKAKAASKATASKTPAKAPSKPAAKKGASKPAASRKAPAKTAAKSGGKAATKTSAKPAPKGGGKATAQAPASKAAPKQSPLPHIDEKTLRQIIAKLQEMREESQSIVSNHVQTDLKPREEASDVGDDLDQASNERDREFNLIMHQRHLRRLQQIDEAFERIEDGSYGLCEGTDEPINPRRLLIMPLARYSLEYQEQQEKMLGRGADSEGYGDSEDSFSAED